MIIILLLVIIAIMLMGSSAFIGAVGAILGFIVAAVAFAMLADLWESLSSLAHWLIVGVPAALALGTWIYFQREKPKVLQHGQSRHPDLGVISRSHYVWTTFAGALDGQMSPESAETVRQLIARNADQELSRFCNDEVKRIYGDRANAELRRSVEASSLRR